MSQSEKKRRRASEAAREHEHAEVHEAREAIAEQPQQHGANEIDLVELFYYLLERAKWIIAAALLGALVMGLYSQFIATPMYQATSKLYVLNSDDSAVDLADLQIGSYLAEDYQQVFNTWEVHEQVLQNLGLNYSYAALQGMLSVSNPTDTRLLYITVTSADPVEATNLANEYAAVAQDFIYNVMDTEEPSMFSRALEPTGPISPQKTRNVILGFLLGAILMAAVFVVRFLMDDKIKTVDDITKYVGLPTLAVVPAVGAAQNGARKKGIFKKREGRR